MSSPNPIGGYFELETVDGSSFYSDMVELNSARNSFEYILRVERPRLVYMPKYTCDVMLEPLEKLHIKYEFYAINKNLEIVGDIDMPQGSLLLYTNYFGIMDAYSGKLQKKYGDNLVIDCSQSFYYDDPAIKNSIYSPRKFFGVADGGYVRTDGRLTENIPRDVSYERMGHLLKRVDLGPEAAYALFKEDDESLVGQPIRRMSKLTKKILNGIDYNAVKDRRYSNFSVLHKALGGSNELDIKLHGNSVPMVYPFLVANGESLKARLIERKVFVPTYWPNVFDWCKPNEVEYGLASRLVALPIDQRYNESDMQKILEILNEY